MLSAQTQLMLQRAVQAFQSNSFNEAELILKNILSVDKNNPAALQILGLTMAIQNKHKDAIKYLERAAQTLPNDPSIRYNLAKVLTDTGLDKEALVHHKKTCELDPNNLQALINFGKSLFKLGEYEKALEKFSLANSLNDKFYDGVFNKAIALLNLKRYDEAMHCLDYALTLNPKSYDCFLYKGIIFLELKKYDESIKHFEQLIAINPYHLEAHNRLAQALFKQKKYEQALSICNQALKIKPDFYEVISNMGLTYHELGQYDLAIEYFDKAIEINSNYSEAWLNKGYSLLTLKKYSEALKFIDKSIELKPNFPLALVNKGNALLGLNNINEAIKNFDRAIKLQNDLPGTFVNKGIALQASMQNEEAIKCFDKAIALDPTLPEAWLNKGSALNESKNYIDAANCFFQASTLSNDAFFALGRAHHQMMLVCNWTDFQAITKEIFNKLHKSKEVAEPFAFQAICDSEYLLRKCAEIFVKNQFPTQIQQFNKVKYSHKKIKLGYLCGEFRNQATSILMAGVWEGHNKDLFEIYAFDNSLNDHSTMRIRIEYAFTKVIDITNLSDEDAARLIKSYEIDILINLNGFFGRHRLGVFSYRPSPIQVNYLGFPGTIGAQYIDYLVADSVVIPESSRDFYTEKIVYLPNCYQANDDKREISARIFTRSELGLPEKSFIFACFNNNYKITPRTFDSWANILASANNSILWLLKDNAWVEDNLRKEMAKREINPNRIVFAERLSTPDHLARHSQADLFLDTWPYNAHTTAADALWAGLPILTLLGNSFPGRVAASLLKAVDLPELITYSVAEYESLAIELAKNNEKLKFIKERLIQNRKSSSLFNTKLFTKNLEAAFLEMINRHERDIIPEHFSISSK